MNVIVADDDPAIRMLLSTALRRDGWSVIEARDGMEAIAHHSEGAARLIISDWHMPGIDGVEMCRRLRAYRSPAYTYFILISGARCEPATFQTAMNAGVDDFLFKPLDLVQVSLRLRAAKRLLTYANRLQELENVIPVCSYCRRLRDDRNAYHQMEAYFERNASVLFSHGVCPECEVKHFPEPVPQGSGS